MDESSTCNTVGVNMSVKFVSNRDGYTFLLGNVTIAEGVYTGLGFELLDDEEIEVYPNAMVALHALNKKYARHTYEKSLSSRTNTLLRYING